MALLNDPEKPPKVKRPRRSREELARARELEAKDQLVQAEMRERAAELKSLPGTRIITVHAIQSRRHVEHEIIITKNRYGKSVLYFADHLLALPSMLATEASLQQNRLSDLFKEDACFALALLIIEGKVEGVPTSRHRVRHNSPDSLTPELRLYWTTSSMDFIESINVKRTRRHASHLLDSRQIEASVVGIPFQNSVGHRVDRLVDCVVRRIQDRRKHVEERLFEEGCTQHYSNLYYNHGNGVAYMPTMVPGLKLKG